MSKFKKGQQVVKVLTGGGHTSSEETVVLRVTKKGVWTDNGSGNDPSGPFDPHTGYAESWMPGWTQHIAAIKESP